MEAESPRSQARRRIHELSAKWLADLVNSSIEADHGTLLRLIEPSIRAVREDVFENAAAPFKGDPKKAVRWLELTRRECESQKVREQDLRRFEELAREIQAFGRSNGWLLKIQDETPDLIYLSSTGAPATFTPDLDTKAGKLADATERLSKATGFSRPEIVTYILTGKEPAPVAANVGFSEHHSTLPDGQHWSRFDVFVRFKTPEIWYTPLRSLPSLLRKMWDVLSDVEVLQPRSGNKKPEQQIAKIVEELGGEPQWGAKMELWERVKAVMIERGVTDSRGQKYKTWQGVRAAYKRHTEKPTTLPFASQLSAEIEDE